ncbi:MAG: hypothetical protein P8182_06500 [Deltaproteobacteria bacterium]
MGEIRSTIDLMMERTTGMVLSPEEKEKLRLEDLRKKAKGFTLKLLERPTEADEIIAGLGEEPEQDRALLESLVWEEMIDALPADESALKHVELMQKLPQAETAAPLFGEVRALLKSGLKDRSKDRKKILTREKKKLASLGISGTAVVPKIPDESAADSDLAAAVEKLKSDLRKITAEEG